MAPTLSRLNPLPPHRLTAWLEALGNPRTVLFLLLAYCTLHFLIRLNLSPIFTLDESEQMLFSQELKWGYRFRHPPLITWLVTLSQEWLGPSRFWFFFLKYAVMFAGLAALFAAGRQVFRGAKGVQFAALATLAWGLTYILGYYPHADLMHTVLLTTLLAANFHALLRVLNSGSTGDYLYFGATLGLGFLSKYVFLMLPVAALLAIALTPGLRGRIEGGRLIAAFLLALLINLPYAGWIITNQYSLTELASDMTKAEAAGFSLADRGAGLVSLAKALAEFTLPLSIIMVALFPQIMGAIPVPAPRADRPRTTEPLGLPDDLMKAFLERTMLVGIALFVLVVLVFGATFFKARWMHQVLLPLPLYLFWRLSLAGFAEARLRSFLALTVVVTALVAVFRVPEYYLDPISCRNCRGHLPIVAWGGDLRAAGFNGGTLISDNYHVAGNFRYFLNEGRVLALGFPASVFPAPTGTGTCTLVWLGEEKPLPPPLQRYVEETLKTPLPDDLEIKNRTRPILFSREKSKTLNYAVFTASDGDCT